METRSPATCNHIGVLLVRSGALSYRPDRYQVTLCPHCGQFTVLAQVGGEEIKVSFELATRAQVEAAGQYLYYLWGEGAQNGGDRSLGNGNDRDPDRTVTAAGLDISGG